MNEQFIKVYYVEFPIRTRGFPIEVRGFPHELSGKVKCTNMTARPEGR